MKHIFSLVIFALMTGAAIVWLTDRSQQHDIVPQVESYIRSTYEAEGWTVLDVGMIAESDRKLTGFAKVRKNEWTLTVTCTATVNGAKYIFSCDR